jgi:hypothetical protein
MTPEEFELWALIKRLGGARKVRELLEGLEKHNVKIDDLLNYLKSVDYKVPNPLEVRISDLEKRVSALERRSLPRPQPTLGVERPAVSRIEVKLTKSAIKYALIDVPRKHRHLFPGYKIPFVLETNVGEIETHVAGGHATDKEGDPSAGSYFTKGLREWFKRNDVKEGDTVVIELVEPHKRYKLYKKGYS